MAYYLNVLRLSTPILMIYFIYCFSYFINKEESATSNGQQLISIKEDTIEKQNDIKKFKNVLNDSIKSTENQKYLAFDPKPIVSNSPKPIVIDSNLVSNNTRNSDIPIIRVSGNERSDQSNESEKIKNTLTLNEIMICRGIYKRNPIKPGVKFINNVDSLFCYTKISNSGNKQEIKHIWYFENKDVTTVSYNIKQSYNYRSWSKKTIYPNQIGNWRVDVVNKAGDILGTRDFTINSINTTY